MTPKEKSKSLVNKFLKTGMMIRQARECALICVDEMIFEKTDCHEFECYGKPLRYWQKVEQEIEKL